MWKALNWELEGGNMNILKKVLSADSDVDDADCSLCSIELGNSETLSKSEHLIREFGLNDSQKSAVLSCIQRSQCHHQNSVKLIWGPPGTGKTKTLASLLFVLWKFRCRTLTCAPTNVAVLGVAARLMSLVRDDLEYGGYGIGDIVLFGNAERMKIDGNDRLHDVFLDHRVKVLAGCFSASIGWRRSADSVISLIEDPEAMYRLYKRKERDEEEKKEGEDTESNPEPKKLTYEEFVMNRYKFSGEHLISCLKNLCKHLPTALISLEVVKEIVRAIDLLKQSVENLLQRATGSNSIECIRLLRNLRDDFWVPNLTDREEIRSFCLRHARLIFCTASSSIRLHSERTEPVELLVIDEAAMLKECESAIPLQISGLRHAILVGDEKQLPAMVQSKICEKAEFGRSLFERLVLLGQKKHLLGVQYRMHPQISIFPNKEFYDNEIVDGPNVRNNHERSFLKGNMFGPYSFINVTYGEEEFDKKKSCRNMVEASVVAEIVINLYKVCVSTKQKLSVGCITPYNAQVFAIQEKIGQNINAGAAENDGFSVKVRSFDAFQGGEEDVIIISSTRCNENGSIGFFSSLQRTNVALTRARYCLWIVGNAPTLIRSESVWKNLVADAESRGCFYDVADVDNLVQAILNSFVEDGKLHALFSNDSLLFRMARWKVCFSNDFMVSMERIKKVEDIKEVISLLGKLARGWRWREEDDGCVSRYTINGGDGISSQVLELYSVGNDTVMGWTIDIQRENSNNIIQVLRVWTILPKLEIPRLARRINFLYGKYSEDTLNRCKSRSFEGNLMVPISWVEDENDVMNSGCLRTQLAALTLGDDPK